MLLSQKKQRVVLFEKRTVLTGQNQKKKQYAAHTDHCDKPKPEVLGHLFLPGALNLGVKPSRIQIPPVILSQCYLERARQFGSI